MSPKRHFESTSNGMGNETPSPTQSLRLRLESSPEPSLVDEESEPAPKKVRKHKVKKVESTSRQLRTRIIPRDVLDVPDSTKTLLDLPLSFTKVELRCVMRFLCALGHSPSEVDRQLRQVYGDAVSRSMVFRWCQEFRNGRHSLEDQKRSGRPKKTNGILDDTLAYIKSNRHVGLRELGFRITLPSSTTFNYMKLTLKHKQYLGCWVPIELSPGNKEERVKFCAENLAQSGKENLSNNNFTNRIVVADQMWINFYTTPLNKRIPYLKNEEGKILKRKKKSSHNWNLRTGPSPSIKMLITIFWDCLGVVAIVFKEEKSVLEDEDSRRYSDRETLDMLYQQVCSKRPALLTSGLTLHMNEELSEEAENSKEEISVRLGGFGWLGLFNPPNSPDLAPSDYYLFRSLKKHVSGKRFVDAEDCKRCVIEWLWEQEQTCYALGIQDLLTRWEKCVKLKGEYLGS